MNKQMRFSFEEIPEKYTMVILAVNFLLKVWFFGLNTFTLTYQSQVTSSKYTKFQKLLNENDTSFAWEQFQCLLSLTFHMLDWRDKIFARELIFKQIQSTSVNLRILIFFDFLSDEWNKFDASGCIAVGWTSYHREEHWSIHNSISNNGWQGDDSQWPIV